MISPASPTTTNADLVLYIDDVSVVSSKENAHLLRVMINIIPLFYQHREDLYWQKVEDLINASIKLGRVAKPDFITGITLAGLRRAQDNEGFFYYLVLEVLFTTRK
ncbi:MAG: hypothetical protein QXX84_06965 [Sulfolobales archaeon]